LVRFFGGVNDRKSERGSSGSGRCFVNLEPICRSKQSADFERNRALIAVCILDFYQAGVSRILFVLFSEHLGDESFRFNCAFGWAKWRRGVGVASLG